MDFYRATLCVRAVFAVARCRVCPSDCLSRWCIVSRRPKISSNFLFGLVAPSFRFFDFRRRYPIPRGTPSAGTQYTRGGWIFLRFSTKTSFISVTVRDWSMVATERRRRIDSCRFRWPWVTPLNPGFKVTVYLKSNISKTVRLRDKVTIEH